MREEKRAGIDDVPPRLADDRTTARLRSGKARKTSARASPGRAPTSVAICS
jgi:hypothetical protein